MSSLMELVVILPQEGFCVVGINSDTLDSTLKTVKDSVEAWLLRKEQQMIMINGCYGPAFFPNNYVYGFYMRAPHAETQKVFQDKLLNLQERAVKAVEGVIDDSSEGDKWKKES